MTDTDAVVLPASLATALISYATDRFPRKCFGYLVAPQGAAQPTEFVAFTDNVRNGEEWQPEFWRRGRYFVDHEDAGFVATADESLRVQKALMHRGLHEVAMFHTHRRHPGNFSDIDYDLHVSRFPSHMWHLIVSLRNVAQPQLRAFGVSREGVRELAVTISDETAGRDVLATAPSGRVSQDLVAAWREALVLDRRGLPRCPDAATVLAAMRGMSRFPEQFDAYVTRGFLRHARDRYEEFVAPAMVPVGPAAFAMGTDASFARHFYGETPRHPVALSPYLMSRFAVTNRVYALLDPSRETTASADLPVAGVSWFEAALCAAWVGCRLPSEAEWEFACGAGSPEQWCCAGKDLSAYAWFSENADDRRHPVGTLKPNALGLHDLHGNVWEWCQDTYFPDYYERSPVHDPVAEEGAGTRLAATPHKVSRGGGFLALAEMCRTRYRLRDPAAYSADDLGFRLAKNAPHTTGVIS